jgi:excisionase family DNA binding protein
MSNLLTVKEAADLLSVSTKTIRRWEADQLK